jgi:CDP-diacylglycerol--glycerol-3-phosphate 3-phosphatidyltransferase
MRHSPSSPKGYELHWPNPDTLPHTMHGKANQALVALQSSPSWRPPALRDGENELTLIVPIIQAGQLNIREEEQGMSSLFNSFAQQQHLSTTQRPLMDLTSGYFGLYAPYQDLILNSHADCRIIVASPSVRRLSMNGPPVLHQLRCDRRRTGSMDLKEFRA